MLLYCGVIKCWNTSNLKASITQACSQNNPDDKRKWVFLYVENFANPYISIGSLVHVVTKYTSVWISYIVSDALFDILF
jgi:hypothetical protein